MRQNTSNRIKRSLKTEQVTAVECEEGKHPRQGAHVSPLKAGHFQELVSRRTMATVLTHCNAKT